MNKVGEFEKVSFDQFFESMRNLVGNNKELAKEVYDSIEIPKRATTGSAGYDFKSPLKFSLKAGETRTIPTGIRVKIDEGWWLGCLPRSGLGFKFRLQLDNTMGVIDSDYYNSSNEGHIFIKVTNDTKENKAIFISAGDGLVQGIFIPYGITYSDNADGVRDGGMGSTGA